MEPLLLRLAVIICLIPVIGGLMCYSCADSSGSKGKNGCQTKIKTLLKHMTTGEPNAWVKNCTGVDYCVIEKQETQGDVKSYIRECSDGVNFNFKLEDIETLKYIKPDNQTYCGHMLPGRSVCVTLCTGDYCNGPSSAAKLQVTCFTAILTIFLLYLNP